MNINRFNHTRIQNLDRSLTLFTRTIMDYLSHHGMHTITISHRPRARFHRTFIITRHQITMNRRRRQRIRIFNSFFRLIRVLRTRRTGTINTNILMLLNTISSFLSQRGPHINTNSSYRFLISPNFRNHTSLTSTFNGPSRVNKFATRLYKRRHIFSNRHNSTNTLRFGSNTRRVRHITMTIININGRQRLNSTTSTHNLFNRFAGNSRNRVKNTRRLRQNSQTTRGTSFGARIDNSTHQRQIRRQNNIVTNVKNRRLAGIATRVLVKGPKRVIPPLR